MHAWIVRSVTVAAAVVGVTVCWIAADWLRASKMAEPVTPAQTEAFASTSLGTTEDASFFFISQAGEKDGRMSRTGGQVRNLSAQLEAPVSVTPTALSVSVPEWERVTEALTLQNSSNESVDWSVSIGSSPSLAADVESHVQSDTTHYELLRQRAQQQDFIRVIARLEVPFTPEPNLDDRAKQVQRVQLAAVQQEVLAQIDDRASTVWASAYTPVLSAVVDAEGLTRLMQADRVQHVVEDVADKSHLQTSTELIGGLQAHESGYTGAGQTVAVLDSGTDTRHPFLADRVVEEACFSTSQSNTSAMCPDGEEEVIGEGAACAMGAISSLLDACAHGTHVAGIVAGSSSFSAGVAPDADLVPVQVFSQFNDNEDCDGDAPCTRTFRSDQIRALEYVYDRHEELGITAVNMSLGGGSHTSPCDNDPRRLIVELLEAAGVATISSSGNDERSNALSAPACVSSVVSVGSTQDGSSGTIADEVSSFSNSAPMLDLLAPGERIESSVPSADFGSRSGTSMASPHVAGAWAVVRSKWPDASVEEIKARLTGSGVPITDPRNGITRPRIQVDAAVDEEAWLVVGPPEGRLPPGASRDVYIAIEATTLPAGTYEETLTVTYGPETQEVGLTIEVTDQDRAQLAVAPEIVTGEGRAGSRIELEQTLTNEALENGQILEIDLQEYPNFLALDRIEGSGVRVERGTMHVEPQATASVVFTFDESVERPTVFEGEIVWASNDQELPETAWPVTVDVRTPVVALASETLVFQRDAEEREDQVIVPVKIANEGNEEMRGEVHIRSGIDQFSIAEETTAYELEGGEEAIIDIAADLTAGGIRKGILEVTHDAPNRETPIEVTLQAVPSEIALRPNYPEPFRHETTIEYSVPERADVQLDVYDIQGRHVARLEDGEKAPGVHRVRWGGSGPQASGTYFVQLRSGGEVRTERVTRVQ